MPKALPLIAILLMTLAGIDANCRISAQSLPPKFKSIPACPAIVGAAATNHIRITGFDRSLSNNVLHAGDSVAILGTMFTKKQQSQWLLYIEGENRRPNATNPPPMPVRLSTGTISFPSRPVPAHLRMLGPFTISDGVRSQSQEQSAQLTLNESFLGFGMADAAAIIWHRNQSTNAPASTTNSFPAKAPEKFTAEEQKAMAGAISTINSYLEIVKHTEGLENLLAKLVKMPSVWSVVRHLGVKVNLFFGDTAFPANPADWDLPPGTPIYYVPCSLTLNDQPALKITLVVTHPNPPRLICGGIVGLLAEKVADNDTYMMMRVVSAKCKSQE